jgi:hypothetical protein
MCEKADFRDICYTNRTREKAPAGALYFRSGAFLQRAYWKSAFEDFKRRTEDIKGQTNLTAVIAKLVANGNFKA